MDALSFKLLIINTKTSLRLVISPNIWKMLVSPKEGNDTRLNYPILYFKLIVFYYLLALT